MCQLAQLLQHDFTRTWEDILSSRHQDQSTALQRNGQHLDKKYMKSIVWL